MAGHNLRIGKHFESGKRRLKCDYRKKIQTTALPVYVADEEDCDYIPGNSAYVEYFKKKKQNVNTFLVVID